MGTKLLHFNLINIMAVSAKLWRPCRPEDPQKYQNCRSCKSVAGLNTGNQCNSHKLLPVQQDLQIQMYFIRQATPLLPAWGRGPASVMETTWLLMPWLLASPGHQHPRYWLSRIDKFLSYMRKDFNCLYHVSVEEWYYKLFFVVVFFSYEKCSMSRG